MPSKKRRRKSQPDSEEQKWASAEGNEHVEDFTSEDTVLKHAKEATINQNEEYNEDENYHAEDEQQYEENGETNSFSQKDSSEIVKHKYWEQRYRLFSMYDHGIIIDEEGWYSVTPERIASHIAKKIWSSIFTPTPHIPAKKRRKLAAKKRNALNNSSSCLLLDAFCGPGGNTIQFAAEAPPGGIVFAIDIDPYKIAMARCNSVVYDVSSRIEFIIGDSLKIAPRFRADAVFLSPPWGGPHYIAEHEYSLKDLQPVSGEVMYNTFRAVSPNIAMLLPRNVSQAEAVSLAEKGQPVEVEGNYLSGKLKTITTYYGALVQKKTEEEPALDAYSTLDFENFPQYVDSDYGQS